MLYKLNGKNVKIPDNEIKSLMEYHKLTKDEAIQLYLEDEGLLENTEVERLTKQAKENKAVKHNAYSDNNKDKEKKKRTVKTSDEKQFLFNEILYGIKHLNPIVIKENKLITVTMENKVFKIDIIETRNK